MASDPQISGPDLRLLRLARYIPRDGGRRALVAAAGTERAPGDPQLGWRRTLGTNSSGDNSVRVSSGGHGLVHRVACPPQSVPGGTDGN